MPSRVWSKRAPDEWCRLVEQAGADGLAVTDAATRLGIDATTFGFWEKRHLEFGKAAAKVRENSARKALNRTEKLFAKSEDSLVRALHHVRNKRAAEQARIEKAMAEGVIWTPEQLAAKVQNLKELRAEARREERAKQKQRRFPGGIEIRSVPFNPTKT